MKKIILLIIAVFFASLLNAQIAFNKDDNYKTYTGIAGDTLNGSYILAKSIYVGTKDYSYDYYIQVEADSLGDGTDITCRLRGSMDGVNYTNIGDAITWAVSAGDTTLVYESFTRSSSVSSSIAGYDQVHKGTSGIAAYLITASDSILHSDTLNVAAQTVTYTDTTSVAAQTITTTQSYQDGVAWRYLQVYFLGGGANADMELEAIRVRILKVE